MAKKTIKKWEKSDLSWNDYFKVGDEIDEETFLYIGEIVPAEYCDQNFSQCGEAEFTKRNAYTDKKVYYHNTAFATNDGKYYLIGPIPSLNNV